MTKEKMTPIRLRMLFIILHNKEQKITAANIATALNVAKSTVTRAIAYFMEAGYLEGKNIALSKRGKVLVNTYWQEKEQLRRWFIEEAQMERHEADNEAINLILNCNEKARKLLVNATKSNDKCLICEMTGFCDKCIDYLLDDGEYKISFTIYKETKDKSVETSLANEGFFHPGVLLIQKGTGIIILEAKSILKRSPDTHSMIVGKIGKLSFYKEGHFESIIREGNRFQVPMSFLKFTYNQGENIISGHTRIKFESSIGTKHMPEDTGIFSVTIQI
ncbi:MAG TPA: MarR family transcriptional regulator [Candidatus Dorea intestinavium]|nr:MarR family transcriptional regulator [Candidatus Dorea intestinavium]